MRTITWKLYVAACALIALTYFVTETTSLSKLVLYNGIALSAVVAVLVGIRRNRPADPRVWYFVAAGLASFLTADVVYYVLEIVSDAVPYPSPADGFYLGMYPLMIIGLVGMLRRIQPGRDIAGLLDAGLVAVATFAVLGILYMDTYIADGELGLGGRLISIAYPVMDVALVAVAARLVAAVHLRQRSFALMTVGLSSLLIADVIYGILNSAGTFQTGGIADAFWLGFYVMVAAAALHPSMGEQATGREIQVGHITRNRLTVLFLVVIAVPVIDLIWGEPFDKLLTTFTSMAMFGLVLMRLIGLMAVVQHKEQQARHDARHDALTGLANRVLFGERVESFVAQRKEGVVSVLFVDLDDFKFINDSLGHQVGDALLVEVARRLTDCVRSNDTVARLSGDEFAVLLESAVDRQDAIAVAQRVQDSLEQPIVVEDREIVTSASVGIAVERRADIDRAESLLRAADVAMYRAKSKGKGRFEFFEQNMHLEAVERLDLKTDLQVALERGQLEIHYQPIVDLVDQKLHGVEALLRWNHPTRGMVMPDKFIPLAEQTGLIVPIGRWVMREACTQVMRWRHDHPTVAPRSMAVNLSVRQLHDPRLLEDVADALSASGLEPEFLTLEITESMLIEETDRGSRALEQLKAMKVKVAIDDFGTGYSALAYLRRFPVDTIKIDRSFVAEVTTNPTSAALVRAVVDLANSLGVSTVAEGIETEEQQVALTKISCTYGQGYKFAKPKTGAMIDQHLRDIERSAAARRTAPLDVEVIDGFDRIRNIVPQLGVLHTEIRLPVMSRTRWLETWASVYDDWSIKAIVVRERNRGQIEAAAFLASRLDGLTTRVVALGHGTIASTRFPARTERAAKLLAKGIKDVLDDLGAWTVHFQQLPEGDPVAKLLAQQLPNAEKLPDLGVPQVVFGDDPNINEFLSRNMRRQIKKAWNRLETDGHRVEMRVAHTEYEIVQVLPELEEIHVQRDHDTGRESDLDDARTRELWRRLVLAHAASGQVEISTLHVDGLIAAFVIGIIDDEIYRVFDGHFRSEFQRYSPGRIIESAVLERAMTDARFTTLDWMAGVAAEKILTSNHSEGRQQLVAASKATAAPPPKPVPVPVAPSVPEAADDVADDAPEPVAAAPRAASRRPAGASSGRRPRNGTATATADRHRD